MNFNQSWQHKFCKPELHLNLNFKETETHFRILQMNLHKYGPEFPFWPNSIELPQFQCWMKLSCSFLAYRLNASLLPSSPSVSLTGGVRRLDAETEHLTRLEFLPRSCFFPAVQQVCLQQDDTLSDISTAPGHKYMKENWTNRHSIGTFIP